MPKRAWETAPFCRKNAFPPEEGQFVKSAKNRALLSDIFVDTA